MSKKQANWSVILLVALLVIVPTTAITTIYFVVKPQCSCKPELVILDYGKVNGTDNRFMIEFVNAGSPDTNVNYSAIELVDENTTITNSTMVYLDDIAQSMDELVTLESNDTLKLTLEFGTAFIEGKAYTIRVLYDSYKVLEIDFTY